MPINESVTSIHAAEDRGFSSRTMALVLAALYFVGATTGVLTVVLPHPVEANDALLWTNIAIAYGAAAAIAMAAARLPAWALHASLAIGTLIITRAVYYGGDPGFYSLWYLWVGLYAFFFFGLRWALAHMALVGAAYGWALTRIPESSPLSRWVMTVGTIAIAGGLIAWQSERIRRRATESEARARELADLAARLERVARTDDLTGLANRRAWDEHLSRELARAGREAAPLSVAVLDLDHFKEYNDRFGHQAGDRLLKELAAGWRGLVRDTDILARYGGEEFAIALPGADVHHAAAMLERLRAATPGGEKVSAGVVTWDGSESELELISRADEALYAAKRGGRDRIVAA